MDKQYKLITHRPIVIPHCRRPTNPTFVFSPRTTNAVFNKPPIAVSALLYSSNKIIASVRLIYVIYTIHLHVQIRVICDTKPITPPFVSGNEHRAGRDNGPGALHDCQNSKLRNLASPDKVAIAHHQIESLRTREFASNMTGYGNPSWRCRWLCGGYNYVHFSHGAIH